MTRRASRFSVGACLLLVLGCGDDGGGGAVEAGNGGSATSGGNAPSAGATNQGGSQGAGSGNGGRATGGRSATGGAATGGRAGSAGMPSGGGNSATDPYGDARTRCVDRTNELRATLGLAPIARLTSAEPCVDGQAKSDSESGDPHGSFGDCLDQVEWSGAAQNECPGYDSVEAAPTSCLDAMWAEGPGGGHYDNMVGDATHTACGLYTTPDGEVWLVQDFWTE